MLPKSISLRLPRLCRKYNIFFYFAFILIFTQLYIGYSFYKINQDELEKLRQELVVRQSTNIAIIERDINHQPTVNNSINNQYAIFKPPEKIRYTEDKVNFTYYDEKISRLLQKVKDQVKLPKDKIEEIRIELKKAALGMQLSDANGIQNEKESMDKIQTLLNKLIDQTLRVAIVGLNDSDFLVFKAPCARVSHDAKVAIDRAKTGQCRLTIAEVACKHEANALFPEKLPRYCPLKGTNKGEYVGCFTDQHRQRLLGDVKEDFRLDNSPDACINFCLTSGMKYAGLQYGMECWCGDQVDENRRAQSENQCNMPCSGDQRSTCGGFLALNVYHTGVGEKVRQTAPYLSSIPTGVSPVRIAFVLTVNGRAARQVRRLFKAIYHTSHYYLIHVDSDYLCAELANLAELSKTLCVFVFMTVSIYYRNQFYLICDVARQDYLYTELAELAERFPNVRLSSTRMSTIWGGASLLQMLLACMRELLTFSDWHWDYVLNLSESDFPLKPLDELEAYLSANKGMNFLRAHGTNASKFIKKQGLEFVFVECETHMWRVGRRKVPRDVVWSGGSDWVCLTRQFAHYVVHSEDALVQGLKGYFQYALLPAETFFHTVLLNSEHCASLVNNNLHATNWNRRQGCKCQYKAVVDWCGCSPNDYLPSDAQKLQSMRETPLYFGRKFEHIISTSIIATVEAQAVRHLNLSKPVRGLQSYWQNEWDSVADTRAVASEAAFTYYHALSRQGARAMPQSCRERGLEIRALDRVHVYAHQENIKGLLVMMSLAVGGEGFTVEALLQRREKFKRTAAFGTASRVQYLDVGTAWDPKEETFRNYGRLLGPRDELTLALWCSPGANVSLTLVYIDPAHVIAASYDVTVKSDQHVVTHAPEFHRPLRPGVWQVRALYAWESVAETSFHVTPLKHVINNQPMAGEPQFDPPIKDTETTRPALYRPISDQQAIQLHSGPENNLYVDRSFVEFRDILKLTNDASYKREAEQNALKTGADLESWVDSLAAMLYDVSELCVAGEQLPSACSLAPLAACRDTKWSSLSPDPKSEIGQIDLATGMIER